MDAAEQEVTAEDVPEPTADDQTVEAPSDEKDQPKEETTKEAVVSDEQVAAEGEVPTDGEKTDENQPTAANNEKDQPKEETTKEAVVSDEQVAAEGEVPADGEKTDENQPTAANNEKDQPKEETTKEAVVSDEQVAAEGEVLADGEKTDENQPTAANNDKDQEAGETNTDGSPEAGGKTAGDEPEVTNQNTGDETQTAGGPPVDAPEAATENAGNEPETADGDAGEKPETAGGDGDDKPEAAGDDDADKPAAAGADGDDKPETAGDTQEPPTEDGPMPVEPDQEAENQDGAKKQEDPEQSQTADQEEKEKQEPAIELAAETGEPPADTGEPAAGTGEPAAGAGKPAAETTEQATKEATPTEIPAQEAETGMKQGQSSPRIEEKGTPEPSTEHMATGTDQPGVGLAPVGRPVAEHHPAPSPVPQYDADATATVKFVLLPTQQVATLRCYLTQTLYELKEHFAQELKIPASSILLMLDGKGTKDGMTLAELGVGPNGTIRLEMQSADPENQPIKAFKPRQEYTMPDVISVRVSSDGGMKDVVVEIERANRKKPFLGGYKHKKTSVEYHHASAQTVQKPRPPPGVERFCRDTQTVKQKHILQQTTNDMATQMTKIGVYINNMRDRLIVPGKYQTADDYRMNTLEKVIVIQKYYRRWLAKRYVEKVRLDQAQRLEWERKEELRKKKEKEDRIRREFERRMNPKTKEDFDLLYHALEKWRLEEINNINETLSGAERKAALCQLLDQETQLIASIGRHKLDANDENRQKAIQAFLEKASSPKRWKGPDGKQTEMDTPYTIRAQELQDIYNSINMKYLTQDERLDVLLTLKHTVKEHDCKLTQEIIELIDREADLLMRGVKESNLEGLRRRISSLFLQYIKTPTFNPEAARLLKVPQDPSTLRKNIYFCPSCNQYLPSTEFQLSSNSMVVGKCRKCNKMDNDARVRQDYSHYRFMLKSIRKAEESYDDDSKIAFLIQENDLRYLVENVWNSQSVLSAWDDLYDLVLVRWDRHQEWSPWNSILLTKEEATAHKKLERLEEAYGKVFLHKVKHKHTLARNYFSRMPGMAEHMRSRNSSALPSGPAVSGKAIAPAKA